MLMMKDLSGDQKAPQSTENEVMDPVLTWEILSLLSLSDKVSTGSGSDNDQMITFESLPFFSQRGEQSLASAEAASSRSSTSSNVAIETTRTTNIKDAGANFINKVDENDVKESREKDERGSSSQQSNEFETMQFVTISPTANDDSSTFQTNSSIQSMPSLMEDFRTALTRLGGDGRCSASDIGLYLGIDIKLVHFVGESILRRQAETQGDQLKAEYQNDLFKLYNPVKQQHEYAFICRLLSHLTDQIRYYCSPFTRPNGDISSCLSLEALAQNYSSGGSSSSIIASVAASTLTNDLEMSVEDVSFLLTCLFEDGTNCSNDTSNVSKYANHMNNSLSPDLILINSKSPGKFSFEVCNPREGKKYLEREILMTLSGVTLPESLESLFPRHSQNPFLLPTIRTLIQKNMIHGVISNSSNHTNPFSKAIDNTKSISTATKMKHLLYIPYIYSHLQRTSVDTFFRTNGYLTEKKCLGLGLNRSSMEGFVKESFPNAVLLTCSIIDPNKICPPLEAAIQSAILQNSFADLRMYLPEDLASNEDDTTEIIVGHVVPLLEQQQRKQAHDAFLEGITIVNARLSFFFSGAMAEHARALLIPLIEEYAKKEAKEIIQKQKDGGDIGSSASKQARAKSGSKKGKLRSHLSTSNTYGVVPLGTVANYFSEKYPELASLQQQYNFTHNINDNNEPRWELDEANDSGKDNTIGDGPLIEFCRRALFSTELQRKCNRAIQAEIDRYQSTRHGMSVSARTEGAAKVQNMEEAFESSFKDMCHLLQLLAKFPEMLAGKAKGSTAEVDSFSIDVMASKMKRELFMGCGSCLAMRITEYCLFKYNIDKNGDGGSLVFESQLSGVVTEIRAWDLPNFYHPVNMASLTFPCISLKCKPNSRGSPRDPSLHLRKIFPGSAGVALSRMWNLFNQPSDSDVDTSNGANNDNVGEQLDQFIHHLEESCLTLVGIPFSILDKKSEKKLLALRRQGILQLIENSNERNEVLMSSIALIYQQVKNVTMAGEITIYLILDIFEKEKKIPSTVTSTLLKLKNNDCENEAILAECLAQAKQFALAKNVKSLAASAGANGS